MNIIEYIKGQRHGKEAHRLERESMQDPFLSDAIDGFDSVEGSHVERIEDMRRSVSRRTRHTNRLLTYTGIAASLLLFITVGSYFVFNNSHKDFIAKNESMIVEKNVDTKLDGMSAQIDAESIIVEEERVSEPESEPQVQQRVSEDSRKPAIPLTQKMHIERKDAKDIVVVEDNVVISSEDELSQSQAATWIKDVDANKRVQAEVPDTVLMYDAAIKKAKSVETEVSEPVIGWKAYQKYLKKSIRRPADGDCARLKGTVEVEFLIDEKCRPYDFVIIKSLCQDADSEAIRLINEGCSWTYKSSKRVTVSVKF